MQCIAAKLGHAPEVIKYDQGTKTLSMKKLPMCICDMYGANAKDVPKGIWIEIKKIVSDLYDHGLEYVDITGYNFIEDESGRVWIIDFGHCKKRDVADADSKPDAFVQRFITDAEFCEWNPEFK